MKRSAPLIDDMRQELLDNVLGKVFIDSGMCSVPRFCQVVGWSKNAEKSTAKIRYIYAKTISSVRLESTHGVDKYMVKYEEIVNDLTKPRHTINKDTFFQCILRIGSEGEYSLERKCQVDPVRLHTIDIGGRYWQSGEKNLETHVFLVYERD